jgi:hypothetical protein
MTPEQFSARFAALSAEKPEGLSVDEYLSLMVELVESAVVSAYGFPSHATLLVGARIEEVKVATSLSDEELLSLVSALGAHMALKLAPRSGKAS